ncbi:unnamed protein product [Lupinus luteus]|uniref:Ferric oxidoreductase domain-containing protein n=1 Tax=Lupinus luteus TaxID=3873 RepID=A0AAV1XLR1_LUPLU
MDNFTSLVAFIPTGWGMILIAQVFRAILQHPIFWHGVVSLARMYDILFGIIVMAHVALLSWLPGFQDMQTRILFNKALSRGLRISRFSLNNLFVPTFIFWLLFYFFLLIDHCSKVDHSPFHLKSITHIVYLSK